jgi:hypothetical protein
MYSSSRMRTRCTRSGIPIDSGVFIDGNCIKCVLFAIPTDFSVCRRLQCPL